MTGNPDDPKPVGAPDPDELSSEQLDAIAGGGGSGGGYVIY